MIMIASCALLDRRYRLAVVMIALAALQNPSAIFFIPLTILTWMLIKYGFSIKRHLNKSFLFSAIQFIVIGSIAIIPYGFYYYCYGVYNLIASHGFIDYSLIDFDRFLSAIFDLNQGMIIGFPGILISIIALVIWRFICAFISKDFAFFEYKDILLLATLVMLMPTLAQNNWNAGQSVFNRYVFWDSNASPGLAVSQPKLSAENPSLSGINTASFASVNSSSSIDRWRVEVSGAESTAYFNESLGNMGIR
jgi:hypothetical protein